jgi:hypothetical protein
MSVTKAVSRYAELKYPTCHGRYAFEAGMLSSMFRALAFSSNREQWLESELKHLEGQICLMEKL